MAYADLTNKNVKFLQGSQADLNSYLRSATANANKGNAIEGAFYLTTDTHRLYVGRKDASTTAVYPEEVSRSLTMVDHTDDLLNIQANDGDFYYARDNNIFAVWESTEEDQEAGGSLGMWVQINASEGSINGVTHNISLISGKAQYTGTIIDSKGRSYNSALFQIAGGTNVSVTAVSPTTGSVGIITVSADDTTYSMATQDSTDSGIIGLKENSSTSLSTQVILTGANTVNVKSTSSGSVTIAGPILSGTGLGTQIIPTATGFSVQFSYKDGANNSRSQLNNFDPVIRYGDGNNYTSTTDTAYGLKESHFSSVAGVGVAGLDVYTVAQANKAIEDAIKDRLAAANAMVYMGSVGSSLALSSSITANGGAHNGDTYKSTAIFSLSDGENSWGVNTGDLIILRGTEDGTGVIPSGSISYDIIPSGDEPLVTNEFVSTANATQTTPTEINLVDGKKSINDNTIMSTRWMPGDDKINISSFSDDKTISVSIGHNTPNRSSVTAIEDRSTYDTIATTFSTTALALESDPDTIGTTPVSFFVLGGPDDIKTDSTGHVLSVNGTQVTFKHNYITSITSNFSVSTTGILTTGHQNITLSDRLGSSRFIDFRLSSESLNINTTTNSFSVNLVWGSF